MAINGRIFLLVEFMHSHARHQSRRTNRPHWKETGWNLGHRYLTCRYAPTKRSNYLSISSYLYSNRECSSSPGSFSWRDTGDTTGGILLVVGLNFALPLIRKGY